MELVRDVYQDAVERDAAELTLTPLNGGLVVGVREPGGGDPERHMRLILMASSQHKAVLLRARVEGSTTLFMFARQARDAPRVSGGRG